MLARALNRPPAELDGLVDLPPGKIAAVATYLEMRRADAPRLDGPGEALVFERLAGQLARYRRLYARVGEDWLWFSRARMADARLASIIDHPDVHASALVREGRDAGLLELDFRKSGECELSFFGLVPEETGRGLGKAVLAEALRLAFSRPVERVWLHTCTLDHPAALKTYMRAGFRPYRRAIEIADDPRLTGHMPPGAAPDFPLLSR